MQFDSFSIWRLLIFLKPEESKQTELNTPTIFLNFFPNSSFLNIPVSIFFLYKNTGFGETLSPFALI